MILTLSAFCFLVFFHQSLEKTYFPCDDLESQNQHVIVSFLYEVKFLYDVLEKQMISLYKGLHSYFYSFLKQMNDDQVIYLNLVFCIYHYVP